MATLRKNDTNSYVAMAKQLMIAMEPFAEVNVNAKLSWDNSPTLRDFAGNTFDSQVRWLQQKYGLTVDGIIGPKTAWWIRYVVGATTAADMLYRYIAGKAWVLADKPVAVTVTRTTTSAVNKVAIPAVTTAVPTQSIVQAPVASTTSSNTGLWAIAAAALAAYFMWS